MKRTFIMVAVALLAAASGQSSPTTILTVDIENLKYYTYDVADYSRLATDPKGTTPPREKTSPRGSASVTSWRLTDSLPRTHG